MRYRYWPNHGSRMYLLENAGDYIQKNKLKLGDIVMIFKDDTIPTQLYISCRKVQNKSSIPAARKSRREVAVSVGVSSDKVVGEVGYSVSTMVIPGSKAAVSVDDCSDKVAGEAGNDASRMVIAGSTSNQGTNNAECDGTFASSMQLSMENAEPSFNSDMVFEELDDPLLLESNDLYLWDLDDLGNFDDFHLPIIDCLGEDSTVGVNKDNDGNGGDTVVPK